VTASMFVVVGDTLDGALCACCKRAHRASLMSPRCKTPPQGRWLSRGFSPFARGPNGPARGEEARGGRGDRYDRKS
jgi:hypothetical protein